MVINRSLPTGNKLKRIEFEKTHGTGTDSSRTTSKVVLAHSTTPDKWKFTRLIKGVNYFIRGLVEAQTEEIRKIGRKRKTKMKCS